MNWLKLYKTSDGKPANFLTSDVPSSKAEALAVIDECHQRWVRLKSGLQQNNYGFYISP